MTDIHALLRATWPPVGERTCGPFTIPEAAGGGKRVTAARCAGEPAAEEITSAERAMDGQGRQALFALTPDQTGFDRELARRGYLTLDPTLALSCPVESLTGAPPPVSGFLVWPPLQVMRDIWAEGRIGPDRIEVMGRAEGPKTAILGRTDDRPAGAGFAAVHGGAAMVHALEVRRAQRRRGLGQHMMAHAANWAAEQGAEEVVVLVTEANEGAIAFYRGLGMEGGRCYHYRVRP